MTTLQAEKWLKDERIKSPCFSVWDGKCHRFNVMRMHECGKLVFRVWWNNSINRDPQCYREKDYDAEGIGYWLERFSYAEPDDETEAQIEELKAIEEAE